MSYNYSLKLEHSNRDTVICGENVFGPFKFHDKFKRDGLLVIIHPIDSISDTNPDNLESTYIARI